MSYCSAWLVKPSLSRGPIFNWLAGDQYISSSNFAQCHPLICVGGHNLINLGPGPISATPRQVVFDSRWYLSARGNSLETWEISICRKMRWDGGAGMIGRVWPQRRNPDRKIQIQMIIQIHTKIQTQIHKYNFWKDELIGWAAQVWWREFGSRSVPQCRRCHIARCQDANHQRKWEEKHKNFGRPAFGTMPPMPKCYAHDNLKSSSVPEVPISCVNYVPIGCSNFIVKYPILFVCCKLKGWMDPVHIFAN